MCRMFGFLFAALILGSTAVPLALRSAPLVTQAPTPAKCPKDAKVAVTKAEATPLPKELTFCSLFDSVSYPGTIVGTNVQERYNCSSKKTADSQKVSYCATCKSGMIRCTCTVARSACTGPNLPPSPSTPSLVRSIIDKTKKAVAKVGNSFQPTLPNDVMVVYKTRVVGTKEELFTLFATDDLEQCVNIPLGGLYEKYCVGRSGFLFKNTTGQWIGTKISMTETPGSVPIVFAITRPPDDEAKWCAKSADVDQFTQRESRCFKNPDLLGMHPGGTKGWTWCFQGDAYNNKPDAPPPAGCFRNYQTESCDTGTANTWRSTFVCALVDIPTDGSPIVDPKLPPEPPQAKTPSPTTSSPPVFLSVTDDKVLWR